MEGTVRPGEIWTRNVKMNEIPLNILAEMVKILLIRHLNGN